MSKTQIARLAAARRRALTTAERALAIGDIASAEQARDRAARLAAKIRELRTAVLEAAASERQANIDAAQAAVADNEFIRAQAQKFNRILVLETMTSSLAHAELAIAMMTLTDQEKVALAAFRANN